MANIKYSALISDIRGKINGSVFSKNKSGLIVRNNATGGVRSTENWNSQKGKFSKITSSWRNLTPLQQLAWNEAAALIILKNSMGENYKISGYNYFSQVNIRRLSIGLPPLQFPDSVEEQPEISDFEVGAYDEFQFKSQQATTVNSNKGLGTDIHFHISINGDISIGDIDSGFLFTTNFADFVMCDTVGECFFLVFKEEFLSSAFIEMYIGVGNDGDYYLKILADDQTTPVAEESYKIDRSVILNNSTFVGYYHVESGVGTFLRGNYGGVEFEMQLPLDFQPSIQFQDRYFYLTNDNRSKIGNFRAIGMLNDVPTEEDIKLILKGYLLPKIGYFSSVALFNANDVVFDIVNDGSYSMDIVGGNISDLSPIGGEYVPFPEIYVKNLPQLTNGWKYRIKSTPVMSLGLTSIRNNTKSLLNSNSNDQNELSISNELEDKLGYIPSGGNVQISISAISANGMTETKKKTNVKMAGKPKFKAGTILTTSVN